MLGLEYKNFLMLDSENSMKWRINDHVSTYLGLKYSFDGWITTLGVKVAGIKIKLPIFLIEDEQELESVNTNKFLKNMSIVASFVGATYAYKRLSNYLENKKLRNWKQEDLITLLNKQEDALYLIKDKAKRNQRQLKDKLVVLRALYGIKSEIKNYIANYEDLDTIYKEEDTIQSDVPTFVSDVTIPVRFVMDD